MFEWYWLLVAYMGGAIAMFIIMLTPPFNFILFNILLWSIERYLPKEDNQNITDGGTE